MRNRYRPRKELWPSTDSGRVGLGLAMLFVVLVAWGVALKPLLGLLVGEDETPLAESWLLPVAMVVLVDGSALFGLVARWRGEQARISRVVTWASVALGVVWTTVVVGALVAAG